MAALAENGFERCQAQPEDQSARQHVAGGHPVPAVWYSCTVSKVSIPLFKVWTWCNPLALAPGAEVPRLLSVTEPFLNLLQAHGGDCHLQKNESFCTGSDIEGDIDIVSRFSSKWPRCEIS